MEGQGIFRSIVKVDDHVREIAEEPWSLYWTEHKTGTQELDEFIKNPRPFLEEQLGIPSNYRIETSLVNHQEGFLANVWCNICLVFPREELVYLIGYKH